MPDQSSATNDDEIVALLRESVRKFTPLAEAEAACSFFNPGFDADAYLESEQADQVRERVQREQEKLGIK